MNQHLALDQKLAVLQNLDALRRWSSLDDRRVCVRCDRVITGRMIDIWVDTRNAYHLHCPTPGCPASLRDWFYHGPVRHDPAKYLKRQAPAAGFGAAAA
jgi:hypothetical protein